MPEAVIVATARSPIGRAFKGSLKDVRPDDLAATIIGAVARQGARARPDHPRRPDTGLRRAGRASRASTWPAWSPWPGPGRAAGHDGQPVLRLHGADHPDGLPRDQGRRGRRLRLGRSRVRLALPGVRRRRCGGRGLRQPAVRRGAGAHRRDCRQQRDLARPARGRPAARRLHRDGPDRRERRHLAGHHPSASRTSGASARRTAPRRPSPTASSPARSPRSRRLSTARSSARTTARGRASRSRASPGCSRCSASRAPSPPATAARSTTARPRS